VTAIERKLLNECVHCGFCLPACPTYRLWGEEMDSPRGRIQLMGQLAEGEPIADMVEHFDACLGCMACMTACPSGVDYEQLLAATRAQVDRDAVRPWRQRVQRRAVLAVFPSPSIMTALAGVIRAYERSGVQAPIRRLLPRVSRRLAATEALVPDLEPRPAGRVAERTAAVGSRRATVGLLTGCVQQAWFPQVNTATARVLAAEGVEVVAPAQAGCCGALGSHLGADAHARVHARRVIAAFDDVDAVIVNSAGCGSAMKAYGTMLADEPAWADRAERLAARTRDISEFLGELDSVAPRHPLHLSVAYHDACHLSHAQGIRSQPRQLLAGIPGLEAREIEDPDICCGSAGVYNVLQPEPAAELGAQKAAAVSATGADLLVSGNPGCGMQIGAHLRQLGTRLPVRHVIEVLDVSIRGGDESELGVRP
jgi:glycolate oxidase iron-sulfur subunit